MEMARRAYFPASVTRQSLFTKRKGRKKRKTDGWSNNLRSSRRNWLKFHDTIDVGISSLYPKSNPVSPLNMGEISPNMAAASRQSAGDVIGNQGNPSNVIVLKVKLDCFLSVGRREDALSNGSSQKLATTLLHSFLVAQSSNSEGSSVSLASAAFFGVSALGGRKRSNRTNMWSGSYFPLWKLLWPNLNFGLP